ncbi:hypothetical protein Sjap_000798 [Stephania japonica]|uniref:Uncharacterized protein n=1 Tax=Stephania japonica TaxID=461633 RepID=A0AAP0KKD3_9MAGN
MASISVHAAPLHRPCVAQARPTTRNLRKTKPNNLNEDFPALRYGGGDATTYTRLPPRDDFSEPTLHSPNEVKLSDVPTTPENGYPLVDGSRSEDDDQVFDEMPLRIDYGEFEDFDEDPDSDGVENGGVLGVENEEVEVKEKGVPAVMRCFDRAKIYVKAGDGGNGVVAFRREKFVPKNIHFRAGRGSHGQGRNQHGAKGEDVVVKVAPGTVIRESAVGGEEGKVLLELLYPRQRALLLPGGRGGRGNASFKTGTNKVPKIAENGEEGAEMWLELELKLVADVGIVGAPNAGKSTLLSVISAAQPTIANYPFTTLLPNLGVVSFDYDATMVVADLPGLLEGAHRGFGLGHEFLRHTERCSVLIHVIDGSGQQPEYEYDAIRLELELFNPELSEKPFIVAYNKMDLPDAYEKWSSFKKSLLARGIEPLCMSAADRQGTNEVALAAFKLLDKTPEVYDAAEGLMEEPQNLNHVADLVHKQRNTPINEFEISYDGNTRTWNVAGAGIQRFVQMTNWQYAESMRRFQHVLEACGVNKSLVKLGVKEGDRVVVGEMEMVWEGANDKA